MPLRSSMADLVNRTRQLVWDPAAVDQDWPDQTIQDALDLTRTDVQLSDYFQLVPTYGGFASGAVQWLDYYAPAGWGDWEGDATLWWGGVTQLTASVSDFLVGHWTFAVNTPPPIYIVGKTYDRYAAAYELAMQAAAREARTFDVGVTRGVVLSRSQKYKQWRDLAELFSVKMRIKGARLVRGDSYA